MTFLRIFGTSWLLSTLLLAVWLIAIGWRGEAPEPTDLNAWLALFVALSLSAFGTVIPAGLFSAAIWSVFKKNEQAAFVQALTTRRRRETQVASSSKSEVS